MSVITPHLAALVLSTLALAGCPGDEPASGAQSTASGAPAGAPPSGAPPIAGEDPDAVADANAAPSKGVKGAIRDSNGKAVPGVIVTVVYGGEGSTKSGSDGSYDLRKVPAGDLVLRFSGPDLIDNFMAFRIWTDEDLTIDVEMYRGASERAEFEESHGKPWSDANGVVFVQFESRQDAKKVLYGGGATIDAKGAVGKVVDADDKLMLGTMVPDKSASPTVEFIDVPPGEWPINLTPPPGLDCFVPAQVMVKAGAYSTVFASCEPPTP